MLKDTQNKVKTRSTSSINSLLVCECPTEGLSIHPKLSLLYSTLELDDVCEGHVTPAYTIQG